MEGARRAEGGDLERLLELHQQADVEVGTGRGGELLLARERRRASPPAEALGRDACCVVVGSLDEVVVGYGVVGAEPLDEGEPLAVITDLYVEPEARGVGVGEAIVELLLDWSREQGCRGVDAIALPGDRQTKNFFERFGFTARAIVVHRSLRDATAGGDG